jgi:hypothetical protein
MGEGETHMNFVVLEIDEERDGTGLLNTLRNALKVYEADLDYQIAGFKHCTTANLEHHKSELDRISEIRKQILQQIETWGSEYAE